MNGRERIRAALRFERPDELPCHESFWEGTIECWQAQGMPAGVAPEDFFGLDLCFLALDTSPRFEQKVTDRAGGYVTFEDRMGYTARRTERASGTIHFLAHANTGRRAWEEIKRRMTLSSEPGEPARIDDQSYFMHFGPYPSWNEAVEKSRRLYASGRYMLVNAYGPWEHMWRHRGMENLLGDLALDPEWVAEMAQTQMDLVLAILQRCLDLGIKPDGLFLVEDLGSNRATLMSPACWRRIFKPEMVRLGEFLARQGIDFWMHSCGAVQALIGDLLECGLKVLNPLQVAAGLDVVELRREYAGRLAFFGNIAANCMLGGRAELEAEIRRKVPQAARGGYIFHSDHSVPPQVDFRQYCWMLDLARDVFRRS